MQTTSAIDEYASSENNGFIQLFKDRYVTVEGRNGQANNYHLKQFSDSPRHKYSQKEE